MEGEKLVTRSLVLVKPDGVIRGLVGEIIQRFEKVGLKIVGMKMVWSNMEHAQKHYPPARTEHIQGIGQRTLDTSLQYGIDPVKVFGSADPLVIGKQVQEWLREYIISGPVVAIVLQGVHAIENVRMIVGNTIPSQAAPGTIRGDYSIDSPPLANARSRPVRNLIHASGNSAEAEYETALWFKPEELHDYKRADESIMFGDITAE